MVVRSGWMRTVAVVVVMVRRGDLVPSAAVISPYVYGTLREARLIAWRWPAVSRVQSEGTCAPEEGGGIRYWYAPSSFDPGACLTTLIKHLGT